MATLTSKIISKGALINLSELYVEVWAKGTKQDSLMGVAWPDKEGHFSVNYDDSDFLSPRSADAPLVYIKIYQKAELIYSTESKPEAIVKSQIPDIILNDLDVDSSTQSVKGIVATIQGRGIANLVVRAYHKGIRHETFLSEAKTNGKGEYLLYYQPTQNRSRLAATEVDLLVKVYKGMNDAESLINSPLIINALDKETINLSVGEGKYKGLDLFTSIHEALEEYTRQDFNNLSARDVLMMANAKKLETDDVSFYLQAKQWEAQWKSIPAEVYFGWFKIGMPNQWEQLLGVPVEKLVFGVDEAIKENFIPKDTEKYQRGLEEKIKQWRSDHVVTAKGQRLERGSVGELLGVAGLKDSQKKELLHGWQNFTGTVEEFWKTQESTLGTGQYKDLELTLQLGAVTRNHLPLIQSLKSKAKITRIQDLASFQKEDWLRLMEEDKLEVPDDVPGSDLQAKRNAFASQLRRVTEELLPTAVLSRSFREDSEVDSVTLDRFMERNPEFEFRSQTIGAYLKDHPEALGDTPDREAAQKELEAVQRVFHLTPTQEKYKSAKVLWQNQLHSAYAIKMRGFSELVTLFNGDAASAERVYNRSSMRHSQSQIVKAQLQSAFDTPTYVTAPDMSALREALFSSADLEALFGDQGFCKCKHCDSFFSPSAYLTDLFLYLNKVKVSTSRTTKADEDTALEKLFKRRPDLGNIELDCENSHTPLPYIDLVNEVLEAAIVPRSFENKPVNILGKNYTLPFGYVPQTKSDAASLKAFPQSTKEAAYTILKEGEDNESIGFPWVLPFDLRMLEVRTYLDHMGVSRADLMESALAGSLSSTVIAAEYLNITPEERSILSSTSSGQAVTRKYWDATVSALRNVPLLLEKTGYSYEKLTSLLRLRYVQPVEDIVFTPPSSCSIADASIPSLTDETLRRMHKFGRLLLKTGEHMNSLDRTIMAFGGSIGNNFVVHYANILRIERLIKSKIDRKELLSWWDLIERHDYDKDPSLYTKLFYTPKRILPFRLEEPTREELALSGVVIDNPAPPDTPDMLAPILSATRLKASDLALLVEAEFPNGVITLNLLQLSYLYSVASFCRAIKLQITEYLALKNMLGGQPVTNLTERVTPSNTLSFIKKYNTIKAVGFEPEVLNYILTHKARTKAPFAIIDSEIEKILKLLQNIVLSQLKEVFPAGTPSREIVETKLKLILGTNAVEDLEKVLLTQSIIAGSSTLSVQEQNDFIDQQMVFFVDKQEAKNQLTGGGLVNSEDRFLYALKAIDRYLLESAIIQQLSESMALPTHIMMALLQRLLKHPSDVFKRAIDVFLHDVFLTADPKAVWTSVELADAFFVVIKIHKLSLLINTLGLKLSDLVFLMENGNTPGIPDFNALPVQETGTVTGIDDWISLFDVIRLSREVFKGGSTAFDLLSLTLDSAATLDAVLQKLQELSGWKLNDLHYLVGPEKLNLVFPQDYINGKWLVKLSNTLKLVNRVGATAKQMASWTSEEITKTHADAVGHAAMAKYGEKEWQEITVPLRNSIREAQRDALVQFVLHHRIKHTGTRFQDLDDIYSYFLIDTQMAACTDTSRIVLAASSVQLFVQRIMMNLEGGMSLNRDFMKEWKWRKYYRVWEANRKVFMWPENWIEPELRDDKTPLFKELENELMQGELSSLNVEKAYVNYLEKLHEVSHLNICGMYEEPGAFHVIARTSGTPEKYYYRKWENKSNWTAWEKIELDISNGEEVDPKERGILLTPVVHNRRLFLFWPIFKLKKVDPTTDDLHLIEELKRDIDTLNAQNRGSERYITKHSNEIDNFKKNRNDIENIQKKIPYPEAIDWGEIINNLDKNIEASEVRIANASERINKRKEQIREKEDKIRDLEKGYHRYHISMAWSQYGDGVWSPKKVSQEEIRTPIFRNNFKNGNALRNYAIVPIDNYGQLRFNIIYSDWGTIEQERTSIFGFFFIFDDCKSEVYVNLSGGGRSDSTNNYYTPVTELLGLRKEILFMKSLYKQSQLLIMNNSDQDIVLLENTFTKGGIVKSLQNDRYNSQNGGVIKSIQDSLIKTKTSFFYADKDYTFFISLPISNSISGKLASPIKTATLNSGTNTLQDSVNRMFLPPTQEEFTTTGYASSQVSSNTFFGATDSTQVIVRNRDSLQSGASASSGASWGSSNNSTAMPSNGFGGVMMQSGNGNGYTFYPFYHPYTCLFLKQLNRYGIEGLLNPNTYSEEGKELLYQATPGQMTSTQFKEKYKPNMSEVNWLHMREEIDFKHGQAYATYNWELFYHIPLFIATRLSQDQRFDEAQKWFHYIFDPTEPQGEIPYRFWKIKPFHTYTISQIKADIEAVMQGDESIRKQIWAWEANPFNPHLLARFRKVVYMKTVVMKYLDNLIAWGDQLFRMDSIESMNEATQLYVLAGQILGKLPIETEAKPRQSKSFNELAATLTAMGNAWVDLENSMTNAYEGDFDEFVTSHGISMSPAARTVSKLNGSKIKMVGNGATASILEDILYFCMSPNEKLLSYWDTVADRLFKLRNCMNIEGFIRHVPLFQPPIDPALLVKAAAAGVDISSAINDLYAPMPYYRFQVLIQKAQELCQELKSLGNNLLSALEKKDTEQLSLIRSQHEIQLLEANKEIKKKQMDEARLAIVSLEESYKSAEIRYKNYSERDYMNAYEIASTTLAASAMVFEVIAGVSATTAAAVSQIPDIKISTHAQGLSSGTTVEVHPPGSGEKSEKSAMSFSSFFALLASVTRQTSGLLATHASYERRKEDWELQIDLAEQEMKQIDKQILAAQVRKEIASKERDNLDLQIENSKQADAYMRNKYTNQELYGWFVGQISTIYFQTYKMAYDMAKQAEKAFRFELGVESSNYIQFGYWDNLKKGLLAGEKLHTDLRRLDLAFLEKNKRDFEITKHISLSFVNPNALLKLKETGVCEFDIPELLFDLDYAGQYFRRIRSVSLTIPCVVGPYTSVAAKLTLQRNRLRKNGNSQTAYAYTGMEDPNFIHNLIGTQSVVTSQAQGDSGMFELNFKDERYLPFEGGGAISSWKLELPTEFRSFDYNTISDVILHMNYTARDGGNALKQTVNTHVNETLNKWMDEAAENETGLLRVFSTRQDFPNEWHRFFKAQIGAEAPQIAVHQLSLDVDPRHFPSFLRGRALRAVEIQLGIKLKGNLDNNLVTGISATLQKDQNERLVNAGGFQVMPALNLPMMSFADLQENAMGRWVIGINHQDIPAGLVSNEENKEMDYSKIEDMYLVLQYMIG